MTSFSRRYAPRWKVTAAAAGAWDDLAPAPLTFSGRASLDVRDALGRRTHGLRPFLAFAGPAVVTSIAYVDPGNIATNIQAGAKYGYGLLWVIVAANLIAMLFQALSAKLGVVTGRNLAALCRERLSPPVVIAMWLASEIAAMATDLAEFLGGAIGFALLLHIPLLAGMGLTAVATFAMLAVERSGLRSLELAIGGLVATIAACYLLEMLLVPVNWRSVAVHAVVPQIADANALVLAVGIVGATVMPHALFLHSGLVQRGRPARNDIQRRMLVRLSNREVVIAFSIAGSVNLAMVMMAAGAFHVGHEDVAEIAAAYHMLAPLLGPAAAGIFLVSLLASGISSSTVGTMAGQMIMQGFVGFQTPVWLRRAITMCPAFIVVALGVDATDALVLSQVVLSLTLPVPIAALVMFTSRRDIMGPHANSASVVAAALLTAGIVLALNLVLLCQAVGIDPVLLLAG